MKNDIHTPRTLVISPNWIGDAVMAQPLLRRLKELHPERPIDVLAPKWVAPAWEAMREVDRVMETPFRHGALQLGERRRFARDLRKNGYVDSYVLPNTLKYALIPWMAGIPRRVGYKGEMRYGLLNVMHHDEPGAPRPMTQFYQALADAPVRGLPRPEKLPYPQLQVAPEESAQALAKLGFARGTRFVAFAPGAEFGSAKRWPPAQYAELARIAQQEVPGIQVLLMGSPKDRAVCDEIQALTPGVRNIAGETSLKEAIALMAQASAVVTNDSGLMHIAAALNRPIVALYGPTDPRQTPPHTDLAKALWLHIECAPCHQRECPLGHHRCMREITPQMAWEPLRGMIPVYSR